MKICTFVKRFAKNEDGGPATEAALLLALVAAIAGFGMVLLGDALSTFYSDAGSAFSPGAQFPDQGMSTTCPTCGGGSGTTTP